MTGPRLWLLAGAGTALVIVGGLLLLVRRRRVGVDDSLAS
ncbi:LPXTG cell wall anchor domain-containing protein [Catellatospora coxensis]